MGGVRVGIVVREYRPIGGFHGIIAAYSREQGGKAARDAQAEPILAAAPRRDGSDARTYAGVGRMGVGAVAGVFLFEQAYRPRSLAA
jgi:hypothetical protein